jgi:4-hydroxy-3-methylbut-2-enyl diphosphate reductase
MLSKYGPTQLNEHFLAFNTICDATQERQDAIFSLVDEPLDLMVVIGGFNSSNTTHLQEIAISRGIRSFHIDTPDRITDDNVIQHKPLGEDLTSEGDFLPTGPVTVGITSGASTPDRAVEEVIQKLMRLSEATPL